MIDNLARKELDLNHDFSATREQIYRAFVEPDQLARWFGPVGYHVPRENIDVDPRVGGALSFVMVSDKDPGVVAPINATFAEVVENELLVAEELPDPSEEDDVGIRRLRLEFLTEGGGARLHVRQGPFTSKGEKRARAGWEGSFAKLESLLRS
jgi:uncharacterized protein YndB with AHSA1/START domain